MVWAHPRGRHFNRTLDISTINFMWRSQRKPFVTHNIWLNKGSTERGHCVKIKNKLLFQVLKFWMSVWPKQIKEAVEKERLEEREQSTNWGKEEIREVSFLMGISHSIHSELFKKIKPEFSTEFHYPPKIIQSVKAHLPGFTKSICSHFISQGIPFSHLFFPNTRIWNTLPYQPMNETCNSQSGFMHDVWVSLIPFDFKIQINLYVAEFRVFPGSTLSFIYF